MSPLGPENGTDCAGAGGVVAGLSGAGARAAGAGAAAGGAATGALASAGAAAESITSMAEPFDTLSPSLIRNSFTTPACGAGTSIVALSDSSVISGSSFFTASPGLTSTSITGTFLKSPRSGTVTSMRLLMAV